MNNGAERSISFGEFELDLERRRLTKRGEQVFLHAKTFDLLGFLAENNGRVVSKDEVLENVWAGQFVEESNLSVQISTLRKALGENKSAPRFLVTVPGKGYKFIADVHRNDDEIVIERHRVERVVANEFTEEIHLTSSGNLLRRATGYRKLGIVLTVLALIVLVGGGYIFLSRMPESVFDPTQPDVAEPKVKKLTNHGRVNTAALSPDGKFFAYSFVERGSLRSELRLAQTDGGSETVLKPLGGDIRYYVKRFSADGGSLYYVAGNTRETKGTLYKMPVLGGAAQKMADNVSIWLSVSSDEKQIAFIRGNRENKTSAIVVANVDGTGEREINVRANAGYFIEDSQAWSADGRFLAVGAANGPDRKNASNKHHEVLVISVADGAVHQLTALEWNAIDTLEWFKDGSGLMAVAQDKDRLYGYQLWRIDYPSGKARLFSRDADTLSGELSFSADSREILAVHREIETNIWTAPANDLKQARQITFSSSGRQDGWNGMEWTPDGRIVYTAFVDQSLTLWIMDAHGTNARQLTSTGFRDERPAVTSDGQTVLFQSNRSGKTEIWRIDADGSNLQQLTFTGGNSMPDATRDGSWVVFRHRSDEEVNTIWRVPLAGGEPVLVSDKESSVPRVSPDGKLVACTYETDGKLRLAILPLEGGEPLKLFDIPKTHNFRIGGGIRWMADGKAVTYPDAANGIWRQSLDGGEPKRLEDLPAEMTYAYAWSHEGKNLAFGRVREVRDAMLISEMKP